MPIQASTRWRLPVLGLACAALCAVLSYLLEGGLWTYFVNLSMDDFGLDFDAEDGSEGSYMAMLHTWFTSHVWDDPDDAEDNPAEQAQEEAEDVADVAEPDDGILEEGVDEPSRQCKKRCEYRHHYMRLANSSMVDKRLQYYTLAGAPKVGSRNKARRAILVFHGVGQNPHRYFCYAHNAMVMAGVTASDVYVLSIGFHDLESAQGESSRRRRRHTIKKAAYWPRRPTWMFGIEDGPISSFAALDQVLARLVHRRSYPKLREVILLGHGGGAQFLHRYAAANSMDTQQNVPRMTYIVANPSSFLYFTEERPSLPEKSDVPEPDCADSSGWHSGDDCFGPSWACERGASCQDYEDSGWCGEGSVTSGYEHVAGAEHRFPESNCCACGGGYRFEVLPVPECGHYSARLFPRRNFTFEEFDPAHPQSWLLWVTSLNGSEPLAGENRSCNGLNLYPLGPQNLPSYFPDLNGVMARFPSRKVIYMAAIDDACNLDFQPRSCGFCCEHPQIDRPETGCNLNAHEVKYPLTRTCAAMAQGLTRVERQWAYYKYINHLYGNQTRQSFMWVRGGHSSCGIMQSRVVRDFLFKRDSRVVV